MITPSIASWRTYFASPVARLRWGVGGGILVLYLATLGVVANSIYPNPAPPKTLKSASAFFPLPVARVDTSLIWMGDYFGRYDYIDSFIKKTDLTDFTPEKTRDQVLEYLVENELIRHLALQQHVKVSAADVDKAYEEIAAKPGVGGEQEIEKVLKELYGMTPTAFKKLIAESLLRERVEQSVFVHVKAKSILVANEKDANDLVGQLTGGGNFDELAKQHSQDTKSRDQGGALGMVGRGSNLPDDLENAIFSLATDAAPIVVKTELGYHVVDTEERVGVIDQNFADWVVQQKKERSIAVYLPHNFDWAKR